MMTPSSAAFDCQTCGACCSYSDEWPRFSLEEEAQLELIPEALVAADLGGMRCVGPAGDAEEGADQGATPY